MAPLGTEGQEIISTLLSSKYAVVLIKILRIKKNLPKVSARRADFS
jgi:hypothetical protein